jgi:large subunit ribosomal protein L9
MRIILKKDVENLGSKGDIVDVAPGFGRNYLIPKKLALEVTSSNMKMIEIERQALKKKLEKERQSFEGLIQNLNQVALSFERKSGEKDMIFGSVSSSDIKDALHELGFEIDKKKILLDEPIKRLGNYSVPIKVFQEDKAEIKVEVIKPEGEIGEEKKDEREKAPEEQLKEDETVIKEPEEVKEEKKEAEIPEEKKEEIEEESIKPEVEMLEKEEKEVLEEEKEEGEMPSDKEAKAEAGVEKKEKKEKEAKKDNNEKKGEKKRYKK